MSDWVKTNFGLFGLAFSQINSGEVHSPRHDCTWFGQNNYGNDNNDNSNNNNNNNNNNYNLHLRSQ